jgi:hypothetical protein
VTKVGAGDCSKGNGGGKEKKMMYLRRGSL